MREVPEFVVVSAFSHSHEAHVARSALDAAGIMTLVADDHLITADWRFSNAVGGVKVLVRAEDFATARELLTLEVSLSDDIEAREVSDAQDEDACPRCGSLALVSVTSGKWVNVLGWLILGFPVFLVRRRRTRCDDCGIEYR